MQPYESGRLFKGVGLVERGCNIFSFYCDHQFKIQKWLFQVYSETQDVPINLWIKSNCKCSGHINNSVDVLGPLQICIAVLSTRWVPVSVTSLWSAGLLASETPALNPFHSSHSSTSQWSALFPPAHAPQPSGQTPESKSEYLRWGSLQPICEKETAQLWNTSTCETDVCSSEAQPSYCTVGEK